MNGRDKQAEKDMMIEAMKAVAILPHLTNDDRSSYLSALLMISYKLLRTLEGDEFVLGWLQSALQEVQTEPPDVQINEFH
jgi:hypothetical protein